MIRDWLGGKLAGGCALALAAMLAVQTARIEGLPLIGGGFKDEIARRNARDAARDLAEARAMSTALAAREELAGAQNRIAGDAARGDQAIQSQIQTVIREVPRAVPPDKDCVLPWGAVRLLDAAASGAGLADVAARVGAGQPDDAASDVKLSEAVALQAANLGAARQNEGQLEALEGAVRP